MAEDIIDAITVEEFEGNPALVAWLEVYRDNPAFDYWDRIGLGRRKDWSMEATMRPLMVREEVIHEYGFAIPCDDALVEIAKHSPIVEVGAGTGYWAALLRNGGVDVIASDTLGEDFGAYGFSKLYTEVIQEDASVMAALHPDHTLLIIWPPYGDPMGADAVAAYHEAGGSRVIYIGEGPGGCTGDSRMFALLGQESCWHDAGEECDCDKSDALFGLVRAITIPQWDGIHDVLFVYERVTPKELMP